MLGGRHAVGLVDRRAATELSVLGCGRAEAWSLVVSSWKHSGGEELFASLSQQCTGSTVADWTPWNAEEVLASVHGQAGLVTG